MVTPSYEAVLWHFRTRRGLYILGAGASVGTAPLGRAFWTASPLDYLRNVGSFPATIPAHSELTQRIIDGSRGLSASEILPGREIRPGTDEPPYQEILQRLPDYYARLHLKHLLSRARFLGLRSDSYRAFQFFYPSLISNYNHDGLAADFCRRFHRVIDMHGTVESGYGSPRAAELLVEARELDLPAAPDGILMGVPESYSDQELARRLFEVARFVPDFIAIIGYSFAKKPEEDYDDRVSLDSFLDTRRQFGGNIYIIQPEPASLSETIADGIKSNNVFGVRAHWNVLAHAFMRALCGQSGRESLDYHCRRLLDTFGSEVAFPLGRDW